MPAPPTRAARALLVAAPLVLLLAILGGLARLGYALPGLPGAAIAQHGALLLAGFFGLVIGLERAVALGRGWAWLAPLAAALGAALLLAGAPPPLPALASAANGALLLAASLAIVRRQRADFTIALAVAAGAKLAGDLGWLVAGPQAAVPGWIAFLVLTIAGERLELSRLAPRPAHAPALFAAAAAGFLAGSLLAAPLPAAGGRLAGLGALALAVWLARYDLARRTVRRTGLTRYIALCLLSGYGWLAAGALLLLGHGLAAPGSGVHDATVHALLVGFVLAMVFGHAPIILPAVAGLRVPWSAWLYAPLVLLHGSLVLRLAGDLAQRHDWRAAGSLGNALALAAFVAVLLARLRRAGDRRPGD